MVTDSVKLSIEKIIVRNSAIYPFIQNFNKSFIIQAGQNSFVKENVFGTESIRWLTLCKVKNLLFRRTTLKYSPFSYQKFNLQRVEIQRGNGVPLAGTPMDTSYNACWAILKVRLWYNTVTAFGLNENRNGIKLEDLEDNHFFLVFDLTTTEEASRSLTLLPELIGGERLTLKLHFSTALENAIELFLNGERFNQLFIDSAQNISKLTIINR